jgi:hypothetical protein
VRILRPKGRPQQQSSQSLTTLILPSPCPPLGGVDRGRLRPSPPAEFCWGPLVSSSSTPVDRNLVNRLFPPLSDGALRWRVFLPNGLLENCGSLACPPRVPRRILVLIRSPCSLGRTRSASRRALLPANQDWTEEGPRTGVPSCPLPPSRQFWPVQQDAHPFSRPFSTPLPAGCWSCSTGHSSSSPRTDIPKALGPLAFLPARQRASMAGLSSTVWELTSSRWTSRYLTPPPLPMHVWYKTWRHLI